MECQEAESSRGLLIASFQRLALN